MPNIEQNNLKLENDGNLALTFIGAGSAFSKRFYQTNLLVVKGSDHLLIDCGTRAPEALFKLGISLTSINTFLITHCHADHIGGLEEAMLINRYGPKKKPGIIITQELQDLLWINCLKGGSAYNERVNGQYLEFSDFWVPLRPTLDLEYPREYTYQLGNINLRLFRTMHIPDSAQSWEDSAISYGVLLDNSVLFTSDTRFDPNMVLQFEERYNLKAIFHDCQLFSGGVHSSIDELGGFSSEIKKKTYLVHYQDSAETQDYLANDMGFAGFVKQWVPYYF